MSPRSIITLTTDFGTCDGYVGAMKGAILSISPETHLVDITHDIPPQDVARAAWTLRRAVPYYPKGTVHVVVVDPGVGTDRRAVALRVGGATLIGPDNGVFDHVIADLGAQGWRCRAITNPSVMRQDLSTTFHGRDIFGPAGAWLAKGFAFEELGPEVTDLIHRPSPQVSRSGRVLHGCVVTVDRFGNVVTNITRDHLNGAHRLRLTCNAHNASAEGLYTSYEEAPLETPVLLIGSSGYLEVAVRRGSAERLLGWGPSTPCAVEILDA